MAWASASRALGGGGAPPAAAAPSLLGASGDGKGGGGGGRTGVPNTSFISAEKEGEQSSLPHMVGSRAEEEGVLGLLLVVGGYKTPAGGNFFAYF